MSLAAASFAIAFITLLVGIATFAFTTNIPKVARVSIAFPILILSAFFFYLGIRAPELSDTATTRAPGSVDTLPQDNPSTASSIDELALQFVAALEALGFQRVPSKEGVGNGEAIPQPPVNPSDGQVAPPLENQSNPIDGLGPTQPDYGPLVEKEDPQDDEVRPSGSGEQPAEDKKKNPVPVVGNIVSCILRYDKYQMYVRLYRLDGNNQWERVPGHFITYRDDGYLKIDGLNVNTTRFGGRGEPYKIEAVREGSVILSIGDVLVGETAFRVFPFEDNRTPWACPTP